MIQLKDDRLCFTFPEIHPECELRVSLVRTLRIPDDGNDYPLPPGLGTFPLRLVDDYAASVPADWLKKGGVMTPMSQAEALWLDFDCAEASRSHTAFPFAVKVGAGKINAVTGRLWSNRLHANPQDYLSLPEQPWLDGWCVEEGIVRQFVAMPLGEGWSVEEQLKEDDFTGGMQLMAVPMKREAFARLEAPARDVDGCADRILSCMAPPEMGMAAGGRMRQQIFDDPYSLADWDQTCRARCFIHLVNSADWRRITGETPPPSPVSAKTYAQAGLPWFDYYNECASANQGSPILKHLKSINEIAQEKNAGGGFGESAAIDPAHVVSLKKAAQRVREGEF